MEADVISKIQVMDGKIRLVFAVEMEFFLFKKMKFYNVCVVLYVRI